MSTVRIGANAAVAAPTVPVAESPSLNEIVPPVMRIAAVAPARVQTKLTIASADTLAPFLTPTRPEIVTVPSAVPAAGGSPATQASRYVNEALKLLRAPGSVRSAYAWPVLLVPARPPAPSEGTVALPEQVPLPSGVGNASRCAVHSNAISPLTVAVAGDPAIGMTAATAASIAMNLFFKVFLQSAKDPVWCCAISGRRWPARYECCKIASADPPFPPLVAVTATAATAAFL